MDLLEYYSQPEILKKIAEVVHDREFIPIYPGKVMGKRPNQLFEIHDIPYFVKNGAVSFHMSVERWKDVMTLQPGINLDENRKGWDWIIDLDAKGLAYAKLAANEIFKVFKRFNIRDYSVKFSGNRGFHIGLRYECFPKEIDSKPLEKHYPEAPRILLGYIKKEIEPALTSKVADIWKNVELDSQMFAPRHMIRAPYCVHDTHTERVSLPLRDVMEFQKKDALLENVKPRYSFLDKYEDDEAENLVIEAFDWHARNKKFFKKDNQRQTISSVPEKSAVEKNFPPCIKVISNGLSDGRKRSLFVLANFLHSIGWDWSRVENYIIEWNKKNKEPLPDIYLSSQMIHAKKTSQRILPPNCDNIGYYKSIGVCQPDSLCSQIKNPVNYVARKSKFKK